MTNPHPFSAPYATRDADALLASMKAYVRQVVGAVDDVRQTDFSGQFAGLYIRERSANYNLDTESTAEDDGVNFIVDGAGNVFRRTVEANPPVTSSYGDGDVSAGGIAISNDDDYVLIDASTQVDISLPTATSRAGRPIYLIDAGGHGFVPVTAGVETLNGGAASQYTVSTARGWLTLLPVTGGYVVASAQL